MKDRIKKVLMVMLAFSFTIIGTAADGKGDFRMLLRLWPHHHTNDSLKSELIKALRTYPGLWDEVWFCMETSTLNTEKHIASANKMALAAQELRKIGTEVSIQGITLGHGDSPPTPNTSELVPHDWTTIVNNGGEATLMGNCPRQKGFLDYVENVYSLYAAACKPRVVWLDDDLRVTNHWPARMLCFCDTCIGQFNNEYGTHYDRNSLLSALEENRKGDETRKNWIKFCQESLALVASRVSHGVHKVSPQTIVGLQHANFHRELLEGYDWKPIFSAIRKETGLSPASRPGNGFYDDHAPRGMIEKALDMARQVRRLPAGVTQIAAEVEGYPHRATSKSPHGLCVESHLYLAMGVTQLSYAIICGAVEPMQWYANNYFRHLSRWRDFFQEYASFNIGTEPGGINPYISPYHVLRPKQEGEPAFEWLMTSANDCAAGLATLGVPFTPDGHYPTALIMDGEAVSGLTDDEGLELFSTKGILLNNDAWKRACKRGFDKGLHAVASPFAKVSCYQSDRGARIAVVGGYTTEISNPQRLKFIKVADWCSDGRLPVISESEPQLMVVPRVEASGSLRSVTLLNCTISEAVDIRLQLRGCKPGCKFVWRQAGKKDVRLKATARQDSGITVTVPLLEGWNTGYIAVI